MVTRSKNKKKIQIGLYYYCHYDMETHIDYVLPNEEQRTIDRYYGFSDPGVKSIHLHLSGLQEGIYNKESYTIDREQGNSYDIWMRMGAPEFISPMQQKYLERVSVPGYQYERILVDESGEVLISAVLAAHEVRMVSIEKK
ncbi:MAG: hypothetical protein ACI4EO_10455 [Blautia sp.]